MLKVSSGWYASGKTGKQKGPLSGDMQQEASKMQQANAKLMA
jgi:hypothetical protein